MLYVFSELSYSYNVRPFVYVIMRFSPNLAVRNITIT